MKSDLPAELKAAIERNVAMISDSGVFCTLYHPGMAEFEKDPIPAIQLAIAIYLDKPIVVAAPEGRYIPRKLRDIADLVIEGDAQFIAARVAEFVRERQT